MLPNRVSSRTSVCVSLLLLAACVASAAAVGGNFWPSLGPGRVSMKRSGEDPVEFTANLRFDFDGGAEDPSGTGTLLAYDSIGQAVLGQFPMNWTTGRGAAFKFDVMCPELEAFLAARIAEATGKEAVVTLSTAVGRGVARAENPTVKSVIIVTGEVTLDGGEPYRLKARIHTR